MHATSHTPMRTRRITHEGGCIRPHRPGRQVARRRAIAEQIGARW